MLDNEDPGTAQRIMLPEETWKAAALGPIRTNHNDVWRERICREQGWFIDRQTKRQRAYFGYESDIRLSRRISAAAEWRNWTYLRRHAEDTSEGTWLLDKCLTLGQKGPARQVAMGLLLGDWRRIRQPAIQSAMRGL